MLTQPVLWCLLAVAGAGDTVLLDFSAPWCNPCRQMEPVVHRMAAMGYPVRQVNIDQEQALAARFQVSNIPCFVLVVDGREAQRIVGLTNLNELQQMFAQHGLQPGALTAPQPGGGAPIGHAVRPTYATQQHAGEIPAPARSSRTLNEPATQLSALEMRLLAASVRIKIDDHNGQSFGSGTVIDVCGQNALVLTCGHIFRDSQGQGKISIDQFGPGAPQQIPGQVIGYDLQSDVGLISFRVGAPIEPVRVAGPGYGLRPGNDVISIGCDHGQDPSVRRSRVTSIDKFLGPPNLQVAGQPVVGRSGGGLFSRDGLIVGVCNAADPTDNEGLFAALGSIHQQLDKFQLHALYRGDGTPARAADRLAGTMAAGINPASVTRAAAPAALQAPAASRPLPLSPSEQTALAAAQQQAPVAQVICLVRTPQDPSGSSRVIVIDQASSQFLNQLQYESRAADGDPIGGTASGRQPSTTNGMPNAAAAGGAAPGYFPASAPLYQPQTNTPPRSGWRGNWQPPESARN